MYAQSTFFTNKYFCLLAVLVCTPHFKYDIEYPHVTKESQSQIHCWFNPYKRQTLLEIAKSIEVQLVNEYQEMIKGQTCTCCFGDYHINITSMNIQAIKYDRRAMATKTTLECLSNEEPFTMKVHNSVTGCVIL